jgi:hypothetical protein
MSSDEFIEVFEDGRLAASLAEPIVIVDLSAGRRAVSLDLIRVTPNKRGMGTATRVLRLITQLSDESGVPIEVIPRSLEDGAMDDQDLAVWYQRHGFQFAPTADTPRLMRRAPKIAC